jgi:hypothetical protein
MSKGMLALALLMAESLGAAEEIHIKNTEKKDALGFIGNPSKGWYGPPCRGLNQRQRRKRAAQTRGR